MSTNSRMPPGGTPHYAARQIRTPSRGPMVRVSLRQEEATGRALNEDFAVRVETTNS